MHDRGWTSRSSSYRVFYERIIMTKYLIGRILRGLFSVVLVVIIVMLLVYSCMDRANCSHWHYIKTLVIMRIR